MELENGRKTPFSNLNSSLQLIQQFENGVTLLKRTIKLKEKPRSELHTHLAVDNRLKTLRVMLQMLNRRLLEGIITEDRDRHRRVAEIFSAMHASNRDEPRSDRITLHHGEHALRDDPLQQRIDSFKPVNRHNTSPMIALKRSWKLLHGVTLDDITDLEAFEINEAHAAFLLTGNFLDFVLEVAERLDLAFPHLILLTEDAVLLLGDKLAVEHLGAGDLAELADVVDRLDLSMTEDDLLVFGRQKVEHAVPDMVEKLVNDAEGVDPDTVMTGLLLHAGIVADVKADDD